MFAVHALAGVQFQPVLLFLSLLGRYSRWLVCGVRSCSLVLSKDVSPVFIVLAWLSKLFRGREFTELGKRLIGRTPLVGCQRMGKLVVREKAGFGDSK